MRNFRTVSFLMATILFAGLVLTCKKESDLPIATDSDVAFAINISNIKSASQLKSAESYNLADADKIVLTITYSDGSATKYTDAEIKIQQMNGSYYTQKIVLKTGDYNLTKFVILDTADSTIFATPLAGSPEAQNVDAALPVAFTVAKDVTTPVIVEVLSTEKKTPEDFGYNRFPIIEVKTFGFMIGVADNESDELLEAKLTVSNGSYSYVQNLDSITNNVVTIKDGLSNYTLTVEKSGYKTYTRTFLIDSMKLYKDTVGNLPMLVELEKNKLPINGLVAYYPFNGNANDLSGNGHNGTLSPNGITWLNSKFSQAVNFDGDLNSEIFTPEFSVGTTFTISLWLNILNSVSEGGYGESVIVSGSNFNYILNIQNNGNITLGASNQNDFRQNEVVKNLGWTHLVITRDNLQCKIFKNGIQSGGQIIHSLQSNLPNVISRIGNSASGWRQPVNGALDELRIYNRILNEQEIQTLYNE